MGVPADEKNPGPVKPNWREVARLAGQLSVDTAKQRMYLDAPHTNSLAPTGLTVATRDLQETSNELHNEVVKQNSLTTKWFEWVMKQSDACTQDTPKYQACPCTACKGERCPGIQNVYV